MPGQSKLLKLSGIAEKNLLDLVLKYELITGIRVNWRKEPRAIFKMVKEALNSDISSLVEKALAFIETAPSEIRYQMPARGTTNPTRRHAKNKDLLYRGAQTVTQSTNKPASTAPLERQNSAKGNRVYRGVVS